MRMGNQPDTIVLIHGMWMTPRCWERWVPHYEAFGYRVMAPAWPGLEGEVEAIRADPSVLGRLRMEHIVAYFEGLIRALPSRPIIIGHSFGGAVTQILLDRGLGAAGVVIDSFGVKGVYALPFSTLKSLASILIRPTLAHRPLPLTREQFRYAMANVLSKEEGDAAYDRFYIPGAGPAGFQGVLANFVRHTPLRVNFENRNRAPLLFVAGEKDNLLPPAIQRENERRYKGTITELFEYPGRCHLTMTQSGWERVADEALAWAERHALAEPVQAAGAFSVVEEHPPIT
jgi:pimeloyl-ACP methyl ester carboxylesterase